MTRTWSPDKKSVFRQPVFLGWVLPAMACVLASCCPQTVAAQSTAPTATLPSSPVAAIGRAGLVTSTPPFASGSAATQPAESVSAGLPSSAAKSAAADGWLRMPLAFEPAPAGQGMIARIGSHVVRIASGGAATFTAGGHRRNPALPAAVTIALVGSDPKAAVRGAELQAGTTNYLLGNNPSRWRHDVQHFNQARVTRVYAGIDLVYYGNGRELEHDYLLKPHADPAAIRMHFSTGVPSLDSKGSLVLRASAGGPELLRLRRPVAYQLVTGRRAAVDATYMHNPDGTYGFALGAYDTSAPLVIDPVIAYSTYFGGSNSDSVQSMLIDNAGNAYVLLQTQSIDLPTTGAANGFCSGTCGVNNPNPQPPSAYQPDPDWFIAKFDPTGKTLLFGTYIGGSGQDFPQSLAVDSAGEVYAWGTTTSTDFPTKNAYQAAPPAGLSALNYVYAGALVKLSADGSQLLYSTYFGAGTAGLRPAGGYPAPDELALAPNGIAYVAGYTGDYSGQTFPSAKNAQFTGGYDFVAKFDTTQSGANSLVYATPIGPPSSQNSASDAVTIAGLAVDSKANLWISGDTGNSGFPTTTANAVQAACGTPSQCTSPYLLELDPTGQSTLYATFFGGTQNVGGGPAFDYATGLTLDSQDNIYWGGRTEDSDFPTKNQAYTVTDVGPAGWVAEFAAGGASVVYSSYAPCTPATVGAYKSATDPMLSFACSLDTTNQALKNQTSNGRASGYSYDTYFGIFDTGKSGASSILVESYLGTGTAQTTPNKTVFDSHGTLWLAGVTNATDLPIKNAFQASCDMCSTYSGGSSDGFVTRIALVQISPTSMTFPSTNAGSSSATMTATISSLYGAPIALGAATLTDSTDFTATDNCGGAVAAFGSCVVTFTFSPGSAGPLSSSYAIAALAVTNSTGTLLANLGVSLAGTGVGAPIAAFSPSSLTFTTVAGTNATNQATTLTNSGVAALSIGNISLSGTNASSFTIYSNTCGATLAAGASCTVTVRMTATAAGTYTASLTASDNASPSTQIIALNGTVTAATAAAAFSPTTLTYATVVNTQAYNQATTLTNAGTGPLAISSLAITGTNASSFTIVTNSCGASLAAGASCNVTVGFTAITLGSYSALLTATDNASSTTQTVALTAAVSGTPVASLTPAELTFTATAGTSSAAQTATLSNTGNAPLTITSVAVSGASAALFPETNTCGASLAVGASCTITVGFTPAAPGSSTASLLVMDNSGSSNTGSSISVTQRAALTGTAVAPLPQASLTPTTYSFGNVNTGSNGTVASFTLTNTGSVPLLGSGASLTGANASSFTIVRSLCNVTLAPGDACIVTVNFQPAATGTFTATLNVLDSAGTQVSALSGVGTTTGAADFTLFPTQPAQSSYRGHTVAYTIQLASSSSSNPFTGTITLAASGIPAGVTASFAPPTVVPGVQGASTVLSLLIPALTGSIRKPPFLPTGEPAAGISLALLFGGLGFRRKHRKLPIPSLLIVLGLFGLAASVMGCGSGNGFATPASTSTITITGTSGSTVHTSVVTLTVE
jgi:hypothetical protein